MQGDGLVKKRLHTLSSHTPLVFDKSLVGCIPTISHSFCQRAHFHLPALCPHCGTFGLLSFPVQFHLGTKTQCYIDNVNIDYDEMKPHLQADPFLPYLL